MMRLGVSTLPPVVWLTAWCVMAACNDSRVAATTDRPSAADTLRVSEADLINGPKLALREVLRIPGRATSTSQGFSRLAGLAVGSGGEIVVLDGPRASVDVFAPDGSHRLTFGRAGQGPGEFQSRGLLAIAVGHDTIFVLERVLHAYGFDGTLIYDAQPDSLVPGEPSARPSLALEYAGDGLLVVRNHRMTANARDKVYQDTLVIQRRSAATGRFISPGIALPGDRTFRFGNTYMFRLFAGKPAVALSRTGMIYYSPGDELAVDVLAPDGEPVAHIVADLPRPKLTSAEIRDALVFMQRAFDSSRAVLGAGQPRPAVDLSAVPRAEYRARIGRILAGDDGALLVERPDLSPLIRRPHEPSEWTVLDASNGSVIGRFTLAERTSPQLFRGSRLYCIEEDATGVQDVVVFELATSGDGADTGPARRN